MTTWATGRRLLTLRLRERSSTFEQIAARTGENRPAASRRTAVFLSRELDRVPPALWRLVEHLDVLPARSILVHVVTVPVPRVPESDRFDVRSGADGVHRVVVRYGFMEEPNIPAVIARLRGRGLDVDPAEVVYVLGRETILATHRRGMALWRERLFAFLSRNARTRDFVLPTSPETGDRGGSRNRHVKQGATMRISKRRSPFRSLARWFLRGLIVVVPVAAIAAAVYWVFVELDTWINLEPLLNRKVPGAGFVLTIAVITLIGFFASNFATRWIFAAIEDLLEHTPLVKLVYTSIKDVVDAFVGEKKKFDRPVLVSLVEGGDLATIGFLTRDGLKDIGLPGHVAVYVPQAYNIGGNVVVVPKGRVRPLSADPGAVMTFVVSGGVTGEIASSHPAKIE